MGLDKNTLLSSIKDLETYVEKNNYKGYEPFDGLSSYLKPLTFGNNFLQRILQQTIRQSPINLRPVFGVPKKDSTKGRGYMAWGYLEMYKTTMDNAYKEKADLCLEWLIQNKSPLYKDFSWGNHFEYVSRSGKLQYLEPTIVWTSLIGQVFLDAFQTFKTEKYMDVSKGIVDWILSLPRENTERGDCLSYVFFGQKSIHNSNMLGAAMLARTGKILDRPDMQQVAKSAMEYSCSRQMEDGSWYYGEDDNNQWIDNFHTGYNLDSLKCYMDITGDMDYQNNLNIGLEYYKNNFFESDGTPKYYNTRKYPIDIQCASQALTTLVYFSDQDDECLDMAKNVAAWTITNMQDRTGYFYYRIYPFMIAKAPMIHWGQATMYKGLSRLLSKM